MESWTNACLHILQGRQRPGIILPPENARVHLWVLQTLLHLQLGSDYPHCPFSDSLGDCNCSHGFIISRYILFAHVWVHVASKGSWSKCPCRANKRVLAFLLVLPNRPYGEWSFLQRGAADMQSKMRPDTMIVETVTTEQQQYLHHKDFESKLTALTPVMPNEAPRSTQTV